MLASLLVAAAVSLTISPVAAASLASSRPVAHESLRPRLRHERPRACVPPLTPSVGSALLELRGGGLLRRRLRPLLHKAFDAADSNQDGKVDANEIYALVLQVYVKLNRQAPVDPPTREQVMVLYKRADKDRSGKLSKEEFEGLVGDLTARAATRIGLYLALTYVLGPLLAAYIVGTLGGKAPLLALGKRIVPLQLQKLVLTEAFFVSFLSVVFIASLSKVVIRFVDAVADLVRDTRPQPGDEPKR